MKFQEIVFTVHVWPSDFSRSILSRTGLRSVHDKIDLEKPTHQQEQPKEKTNTQAANTHTQTQAQGENTQHNQLAFPRVPETRFQETGHPSWPILPMFLCSLWTAKGSAVHCELHDFKIVKKTTHTPVDKG